MARSNGSLVQRQLGRVSRRLFLQTVGRCLIWCWMGALVLAAGWFVAQPFWFPTAAEWVRPTVAGGLMALGAGLAIGMAVWKAPTKLTAALMLDEKFGLKERVTTSLTLTPAMEATAAAQALLADVNQRVEKLDVGSKFPMRASWHALLPVVAGGLAVAAFFYQPPKTEAITPQDELAKPTNPEVINQKVENIRKRNPEKKPLDKVTSEKLKEMLDKLDDISKKPFENKEQIRDRIKEMTALEKEMQNREKELADKTRALNQQLKQLDQMNKKDGMQEGPAKDLQKALSEGKLDMARDEMEKLAKKLKDKDGLSAKEKEQLAKQLEDIQKKLERLAQQKDKEQDLKKRAQEGKLDAETLKRELDKIKEEKEKLKKLQDIANKLGKSQSDLKEGKADGAAQSLEEAADQLKDIDLQDQELQDLREELQKLQDLKDSC